MKACLAMIRCLWISVVISTKAISQDSSAQVPFKTTVKKPEVFSSGFIDVSTGGQVNASARILRIFLGEPGKFSLPVSIYSGVSSGNFASQNPLLPNPGNEALFTAFINPLSGLVNLSLDGNWKYGRSGSITSLGFLCQGGGRVLTGFKQPGTAQPSSRPVNFFNGYAVAGLHFQTGAWEKNDAENFGFFWLAARYICSFSSPSILSFFVQDDNNGFYHGWSIGGGVDITQLVNFKVIYYKYVRGPDIISLPSLCQFSFHYSLNRD